MIAGMLLGADVWWTFVQSAVLVVLAVVFHRLRDRHLLDASAHLVFPPALAVGYVLCTAIGWAVNVALLVQLARGTVALGDTSPVYWPELLLVLGWFVLAVIVWRRLDRVDAELHGPIAALGRFLRVGVGTAVPAALRSLRAESRNRCRRPS